MATFDPIRKFLLVRAIVDESGVRPDLPPGVTEWVGNRLRPDVYLIMTTDEIEDPPRAGVDFDLVARAVAIRDATPEQLGELLPLRLANDGADETIRWLQGVMGATQIFSRAQLGAWSVRGV